MQKNKDRSNRQIDDWDLLQEEWIVELFGYVREDHDQILAMSNELHRFAQRLIPIVNFVKMDNIKREYLAKVDDHWKGTKS